MVGCSKKSLQIIVFVHLLHVASSSMGLWYHSSNAAAEFEEVLFTSYMFIRTIQSQLLGIKNAPSKKNLAHFNPKTTLQYIIYQFLSPNNKWISSVVVSTSDSQARGPRFAPPLRQGNSFKFHFKFFIKCRET